MGRVVGNRRWWISCRECGHHGAIGGAFGFERVQAGEKERGFVMTAQRRNSSGQFKRCVKAVKRSGSAYDPNAVCAASERRRGLINGKRGKKNPLPLVAAEALETQALTPYQKKATAAGKQFQKRIGLKLNKGKRKNPSRRNPLEQSSEVYEGFHGRPSEKTVEITTRMHEHVYVAGLGELVALYVNPLNGGRQVKISGFETGKGKPAFLTSNEKRTQLYIEGGDQRVNLADFGIKSPIHESECLGELARIEYYTVKDHLGDEGGEAVYSHKFSKRCLPLVNYDTRNGLLSISGGKYTIEDEGITN
jgi:hypothetical protein